VLRVHYFSCHCLSHTGRLHICHHMQLPVSVIVAEVPSGKITFTNQHTEEIMRQPKVFFGQMENVEKYRTATAYVSVMIE
jgi:hypothetical protein